MATYFLSAVNGSDAAAGDTTANAKQTFAGILALSLAAGDLIWVESNGVFTESVTTNVAGTVGNEVIWRVDTAGEIFPGSPGGPAIIDGENARNTGIVQNVAYNRFEGFQIWNTLVNGIDFQSTNCTFSGGAIVTGAGSLFSFNGADNTIQNARLSHGVAGLSAADNSDGNVLRRCIFTGQCLYWSFGSNLQFIQNTFLGNADLNQILGTTAGNGMKWFGNVFMSHATLSAPDGDSGESDYNKCQGVMTQNGFTGGVEDEDEIGARWRLYTHDGRQEASPPPGGSVEFEMLSGAAIAGSASAHASWPDAHGCPDLGATDPDSGAIQHNDVTRAEYGATVRTRLGPNSRASLSVPALAAATQIQAIAHSNGVSLTTAAVLRMLARYGTSEVTDTSGTGVVTDVTMTPASVTPSRAGILQAQLENHDTVVDMFFHEIGRV